MSIKGRWSRFVSRSTNSSTDSTHEPTSPVSGPSSSSSSLSSSQPSRLKKTISWVSSGAAKESKGNGAQSPNQTISSPKTKSSGEKKKRIHPSLRPLTETNLRHQEMLSKFSWADIPPSSRRLSYDSDISPTSSRRGSLDALSFCVGRAL